MKRIDRYIFRELLGPTLLSLTLYIFLLFMNVLFDVAREAIENQISLMVILKLLYYQLPALLVVSLPMSILLGILIGVGRMSSDTEIVALQASGVPFRRLMYPVLTLGLLVAGICFYFVGFVAPQGTYMHHQVKREVYLSRYINSERIVPRVFHQSLPGMLLYYDAREPGTGALRRVFLYESDPKAKTESVTVARRGLLSFDDATGRVNLTLEDGATHGRQTGAGAPDEYSVISFQSYTETREPPPHILAFSKDLPRNQREMTFSQLSREIRLAREEQNDAVRRLRVGLSRTNFHERFALPMAAPVFALMALPLGVVNRRGGKASGFALSLAVVLVYWVSYSVLRDLAETGKMDAVLALWLPNAFFALAGAILTFGRIGRQRTTARASLPGRLWRRIGDRIQDSRRRRADARARSQRSPRPRPHFPMLIDRYVTGHYLRVFIYVMFSVYLVYLLVEFRSLIEDMMDNDVGTGLILRYLALLIPRMTTTILPVACLVATLVGVGLMARTQEDTAVKAAGVSVHRLLLPLLILTSLFAVGGFFIQDDVLPATNRAAATLRDRISGRGPRSLDPRHRWVMSDDHRLYHFDSSEPDRQTYQGFNIFDLDPATFAVRSRLFAQRARWSRQGWTLSGAWQREFDQGTSTVQSMEGSPVDLGVSPELFASEETIMYWGVQREPDQMSYRDQRNYIRELGRRGYDTTTLQVALAQKLAFPLIPLFMVLLGFPFSFRVGAHGSLFGVGLAIALSVVYWSAMAVCNALGTAEILPPVLAAWAPNIFFAGVGVYLSLSLRT